MMVWFTRIHLATLSVRGALGEYWKRIAIGAFCGWLLSSVLGAFALVASEQAHLITAEDSAFLGPAVVLMGMGVGGLVAYVAKPDPAESRAPHE